jgi:hypothetical protein
MLTFEAQGLVQLSSSFTCSYLARARSLPSPMTIVEFGKLRLEPLLDTGRLHNVQFRHQYALN